MAVATPTCRITGLYARRCGWTLCGMTFESLRAPLVAIPLYLSRSVKAPLVNRHASS
jgi:hypothetical protein